MKNDELKGIKAALRFLITKDMNKQISKVEIRNNNEHFPDDAGTKKLIEKIKLEYKPLLDELK